MPFPKPPKRIKNRKVKEWSRIRQELKIKFEQAGITSCEARFSNCLKDNYLGFAHPKKRRYLTPEELYEVAILCNSCHSRLEYGNKQIMEETIRNIIINRKPSIL